jgi:dihydrofolate synthase/folylpolyglutamate synthase
MSHTYQEILDYLYRQLPMFQRVGPAAFKKDLRNIQLLMEAYDHPHRQFPSIHIAGTNGKGSTAHLLAAVLQAHGLKVGLYTSPHYKDFRERVKVNGQLIGKKK